MKYIIAAESSHRIRIHLIMPRLNAEQAEIIKYAFSGIAGVNKVTIYRETAGCALEYSCPKEELLRKLDHFRLENVKLLAAEEQKHISAAEMRSRKLAPELKRKLRLRILAETAADLAMPVPVQLAYHAYQMVTLKEM